MDSKLAIITELERIETSKKAYQAQLTAIESQYFKSGEITFLTNNNDHDCDDCDDCDENYQITVDYDTKLMVNYIKSELISLTNASDKLINKLSNII